jgi:hypothetical protein
MRYNFALGLAGIITGLCLATAPGRAASLSYVFTPGTSTTLLGTVSPVLETITGSFTFDAATNTESLVNITLAGPGPYAGTYIQTTAFISTSSKFIFANSSPSGSSIGIGFVSPLTVSPDALSLVEWCATPLPLTGTCGGSASDTDPTGAAIFATVPPAPVPLPTALPLFASGLGAFGLLGWRRKRKAAAAIA